MKFTKNDNVTINKIMSIQELLQFEQKYCDMLNFNKFEWLPELIKEKQDYIDNYQYKSENDSYSDSYIINSLTSQIESAQKQIEFAEKQIKYYRQEIKKALSI